MTRPLVMQGPALSEYGFPADHPNAIDRQAVFWAEAQRLGLDKQVVIGAPRLDHGDGVYYSYESDPELIFADIHEDGRCLYPGTGDANETGKGVAAGTKLNIPMPPRANDRDFLAAWDGIEAHLERHAPEFIILQAGADSLAGDPLADLRFTAAAHAHAARRLAAIADRCAQGRLMVFGGGGYHPTNVAAAWTAVLRELIGVSTVEGVAK